MLFFSMAPGCLVFKLWAWSRGTDVAVKQQVQKTMLIPESGKAIF